MTTKQLRDLNSCEFEYIYEDGVEIKRKNEGYHPSGKAYFNLDQKTIDEALAWWTKPDVIKDANMR